MRDLKRGLIALACLFFIGWLLRSPEVGPNATIEEKTGQWFSAIDGSCLPLRTKTKEDLPDAESLFEHVETTVFDIDSVRKIVVMKYKYNGANYSSRGVLDVETGIITEFSKNRI